MESLELEADFLGVHFLSPRQGGQGLARTGFGFNFLCLNFEFEYVPFKEEIQPDNLRRLSPWKFLMN